MSGVKDIHTQIWLAAAVASVNFFCTFIGLYLVERIGRRPLTLYSLAGVTWSLFLLGVAFQLMASQSPPLPAMGNLEVDRTAVSSINDPCTLAATCDACITQWGCGYCYDSSVSVEDFYNATCLPTRSSSPEASLVGRCSGSGTSRDITWAYNWCPTAYSWLIILGLVAYLFCFAPGMGPMPWTINSEFYPQWARGVGNSISTFTNWSSNLLVSITFLTLTDTITKQGTYYLYTSIGLLGLAFFWWVLPETKGRSLEEVERLFSQPWLGRQRPSAHSLGMDEGYLRLAGRSSSMSSSNASSTASLE